MDTSKTNHGSPLYARDSIGDFLVIDLHQLAIVLLVCQGNLSLFRYPGVGLEGADTRPVLMILRGGVIVG